MTDSLADIVRDLKKVSANSGKFIRQAVEVSARGAKDDWKARAKKVSGKHAKRYPTSIDYDVNSGASLLHQAVSGRSGEAKSITAVVGPNLGKRQGSLGILEDANGGVKSKPQNIRREVARAAEADLDRGLTKALDDALKEGGF